MSNKADYEQIITAGAHGLAENEFWCVFHPEGAIEETGSKRLDIPVLVACEALKTDWDILTDQGFYLGKSVCDPAVTAGAKMAHPERPRP